MIITFAKAFGLFNHMETDVKIRQIRRDDCLRIAELSLQLGYPSSAEEIQTRLTELASDKDNCTFAAVLDEKVVGWIHAYYAVRIEVSPFVEIGGLVVDENHRGRHIGEKLVTVVTNWSLMRGVKVLRVRSNIKRLQAHEFYMHIGFKEIKEQKVFILDLE